MMSREISPPDRFWPLVEAACLGAISQEESGELQDILRGNSAAQQLYLEYCRMHAELRTLCGVQRASDAVRPKLVAPAVSPAAGFPNIAMPSTEGYFASGWPVAYLVATVIFGIGLMIGGLVHVSQPEPYAGSSVPVRTVSLPSPVPNPSSTVARITGMADCVLSDGECRMLNAELRTQKTDIHYSSFITQHSPVHLGDRLALKSGLLEITYDTGARVILQGPVTYEVESLAGGYLSVGKLTARLEKKSEVRGQRSEVRGQRSEDQKSEIVNQEFAVRTPTAIVTDLGTEFGVEVSREGTTTSHVFRGSISVQAATPEGKVHGAVRVLHENESVSVDARRDRHAMTVVRTEEASNFVREIPKQTTKSLSLVDVVAGGDGFGSARNRGIDPLTGALIRDYRRVYPDEHTWSRTGDYRYHRVDGAPFVDGVFIPQADKGPVQLDSAGHAFNGFVTFENLTSGCTWAGSSILNDREGRTKLCDVDYASPGHGLLSMHANQGITFDLDAVRRANPGCKAVRFRAVLANPETGCTQGLPTMADAWVFVDGQVRSRCRQINGYSGAVPVNVPLDANSRFLTLVATDGGNSIDHDWVIFGDPRIELEEPASRNATTPSVR
jgi:hypothetical protein